MPETEERKHVEGALDQAVQLLERHFDAVDQRAAVELASLLYSTREHEQFLREHPREPSTAYP